MTTTRDASPRGTKARLHRAWWVALVTLGVLVAAAVILVLPRSSAATAG